MRPFLFALFSILAVSAFSQTVPRFGTPTGPGRVIADPPTGGVTSPCLREDELEIFYESLGNLWRGSRAVTTVPFENTQPLAELSTLEFAEERPFLTPDGLGLYFTRYKSTPSPSRKVYYSRRWGIGLPFLSPIEVGIEGLSYFEGGLGSVSGDERTLYLEIVRSSAPGSGLPQHTDIAYATRTATTEKFGMWKFINELNTTNLERGPAVSRDEKTLYFSVLGVGIPGYLFASTRSDRNSPFNPRSLVQGVNSAGVVNRDPFIAFPGSRLYFVSNEELVYSNRILSATYRIGEAEGISGRRVLLPMFVETPEPDAILFEAPVFFNPNLFSLERVIPGQGLGLDRLEIQEVSQGRYRVIFQSENPLQGTDEDEKIFDLEFVISNQTSLGTYPVASGGTYRLNKIDVPAPASGHVAVRPGPGYPPAGLIKLW